MGKVQYINKARKTWKCQKCGAAINIGDSYYKGEVNFGPTFIRCNKCKLQGWEVTTSDWTLRIGRLVNMWQEDFGIGDGVIDDITNELSEIQDDLQEKLDNMPEGLQEGDVGQLIQDRIDAVESAISDLECLDIDNMKEEAASELKQNLQSSAEDEAEEDGEESTYDADEDNRDYDQLVADDTVDDSARDEMVSSFEGSLAESIDDILGEFDY